MSFCCSGTCAINKVALETWNAFRITSVLTGCVSCVVPSRVSTPLSGGASTPAAQASRWTCHATHSPGCWQTQVGGHHTRRINTLSHSHPHLKPGSRWPRAEQRQPRMPFVPGTCLPRWSGGFNVTGTSPELPWHTIPAMQTDQECSCSWHNSLPSALPNVSQPVHL